MRAYRPRTACHLALAGASLLLLGVTASAQVAPSAAAPHGLAPAPSASTRVAPSAAPATAGAPERPGASASAAAPSAELVPPPPPAPTIEVVAQVPSVAPEPPALPSASASASASASVTPPSPSVSSASVGGAKPPEAPAKIHDTVVFSLRRGQGGKTMEERAHGASEALERAVETSGAEEVRVVAQGDERVVYAGSIPIVVLYPEDAAPSGYESPDTHAAAVAARVRDAVRAEKKRSAIAGTVFSFSLLVFVGLVAFYVLRKIGEFFERARQWMLDNPDRITGIRIQSQEVVGATALRGGALVTLIVGRFVAQLGVAYLWLVFALSLFESTRPYTTKLTGFVVTPLSDLTGRLAAGLPLAVVAVVSSVAVYVLLRFVQLFFEGVARRQTVIPWLPPDLAAPTSVLVRVGVVIVAIVFAAPIVTGDSEGTLARAGAIALLGLALSSTPLVASVIVGMLVVYGRRVRVGQHASIGRHSGRVVGVGLVDVRLLDGDGCDVRVPHLLALVHPTTIAGVRPRLGVDVVVSPAAPPKDVQAVLLEAASLQGERPSVELSHIDSESAIYRVTVSVATDTTAGVVRLALAEALAAAGFSLGRARGRAESS